MLRNILMTLHHLCIYKDWIYKRRGSINVSWYPFLYHFCDQDIEVIKTGNKKVQRNVRAKINGPIYYAAISSCPGRHITPSNHSTIDSYGASINSRKGCRISRRYSIFCLSRGSNTCGFQFHTRGSLRVVTREINSAFPEKCSFAWELLI